MTVPDFSYLFTFTAANNFLIIFIDEFIKVCFSAFLLKCNNSYYWSCVPSLVTPPSSVPTYVDLAHIRNCRSLLYLFINNIQTIK